MPSLNEPTVAAGVIRALSQPTLTVDDLTLRPWQLTDAPGVLQAYQDPAIQQWHIRGMTELAEAAAWIESRSDLWEQETGADWAVTADDQLVGRIGFNRFELWDGIGELAYWVMPPARGRNIAGRAVTALTQWSFDVLGLHRLELRHSTQNEASCRVALKVGFDPEGTMRGQGLHQDGWHDMHLHARLA